MNRRIVNSVSAFALAMSAIGLTQALPARAASSTPESVALLPSSCTGTTSRGGGYIRARYDQPAKPTLFTTSPTQIGWTGATLYRRWVSVTRHSDGRTFYYYNKTAQVNIPWAPIPGYSNSAVTVAAVYGTNSPQPIDVRVAACALRTQR